jgi:hypothetical protein
MRPETAHRIVGGLLAGGAALGLVTLGNAAVELSAIWEHAVATGQGHIVWANAALLVVFAGLATVSLVGGVQTLNRGRHGYWLSLAGLLPQLFSILVPGFQYRFALLSLFALGASYDGTRLRAGIFFEGGTQVHVAFESVDQWVLQLNIGALILVVSLLALNRTRSLERSSS